MATVLAVLLVSHSVIADGMFSGKNHNVRGSSPYHGLILKL